MDKIIITNYYSYFHKALQLKTFEFEKVLKFLTVADNKDKLLKVLQYVVKLIIVSKGAALLKPANSSAIDLKSFASTLSLARKLGRLGNWLPGIQDLYDLTIKTEGKLPVLTDPDYILKVVSASASAGNDLLDDWICLQKGRLLQKEPFLDNLDLWSTRLWFISVSIDLSFTLRKLKDLKQTAIKSDSDDYKKKQLDLILAAAKQFCDWTFCIWELAELGKYNEQMPVLAGLSAAVIGAIRGWRKIK